MASVNDTARVSVSWRARGPKDLEHGRTSRVRTIQALRAVVIFVVLLTGCTGTTTTVAGRDLEATNQQRAATSPEEPADEPDLPAVSEDVSTDDDASAEESVEISTNDPAITDDASAEESVGSRAAADDDASAEESVVGDLAAGNDWAAELVAGVCFDEVLDQATGDLLPGEPISCDGPHQFEVFHQGGLSDGDNDGDWPGFDPLVDEAFAEFCDDELVAFGGRPWDQLPLATFAWVPDEMEWNEGSRSALCTVASDIEGASMTGTAAGSSLAPVSTDFMFSMVVGSFGGLEIAMSGTNSEFASLTANLPAQDLGLYGDALAFDGERLLYFVADPNNDGSRTLMHIDLGTGEIERVDAFDGRDVWNPTAGGNGNVIVSAGSDGSDTELWTVADGTATVLTDTPGLRLDHPVVPADGGYIVLSAAEAGVDGSSLWRLDVATLEFEQLTDGSAIDTQPALAPDESQIVFTSDRSGNLDVWSMEPDGSSLTNLTNHPSRDSQPTYSLATDRVFFQSDRFGHNDNTMFMLRDGSEQGSVTFEGVRSPEVVANDLGALFHAAAFNNQLRLCPVYGGEANAACAAEVLSVTTHPEPAGAPWPGEEVLTERTAADCAAALDELLGADREPQEVVPALITETVWDFGTRTSGCLLANP